MSLLFFALPSPSALRSLDRTRIGFEMVTATRRTALQPVGLLLVLLAASPTRAPSSGGDIARAFAGAGMYAHTHLLQTSPRKIASTNGVYPCTPHKTQCELRNNANIEIALKFWLYRTWLFPSLVEVFQLHSIQLHSGAFWSNSPFVRILPLDISEVPIIGSMIGQKISPMIGLRYNRIGHLK